MKPCDIIRPVIGTILLLAAILPTSFLAAEPLPSKATTRPAEKEKEAASKAAITVAILDFEAKDPGSPDLGKQIGEALIAILSGEPGITLVERATLARTLQEQELNLSGLVDTDQAIKVGKLAGAKIIVTGKAFMMGQKLFITAKIIGAETSLVEGVLVKGDGDTKVDELVMKLAAELSSRLHDKGPKLVAQDDPIDPIPALKKKLANRKLPTVAIIVVEEHRGTPARQPIDPAVETELKLVLRDCGVTVQDVAQNDLADWNHGTDPNHVDNWPRGLQGVDVVITGKAFSEFAARIGNLVSCGARAEINVINRKDGKIILADRVTTRDVDLSENIAGKRALQKAGRALAVRILSELDATAPMQKEEPR